MEDLPHHLFLHAGLEQRVGEQRQVGGVAELARYLNLISTDAVELQSFLDRVTINVSQLWRNPEQWTMLAEKVLPVLAEKGRISIADSQAMLDGVMARLAEAHGKAKAGAKIEEAAAMGGVWAKYRGGVDKDVPQVGDILRGKK